MTRRKQISASEFDNDELASAAEAMGVTVETLPMKETADQVVDYLPPIKKVGEGLVVSVKVPVGDVRLMDEIIHSPDGIFDGQRSDFVRTAIYYLARIYKTHFKVQQPSLVKAVNRAILERERASLEQKIEDLHEQATTLRNTLCYWVDRGEDLTAMIELNRWFQRQELLEPVERDRYLRIIVEVPICQYVANMMRNWDDRLIPDELLKNEDEGADGAENWANFLSEIGIPLGLTRFVENGKAGKWSGERRRATMTDYMRRRRQELRERENAGTIVEEDDGEVD